MIATGIVDTPVGGVWGEIVVTIGVGLMVGLGNVHADKFGRMWFTGIVNVGILGGTNGGCETCEKVLVAWRIGNCCEMADVDGPGTGTVGSGGVSDGTACATALGPTVGTGTTVVGTPTAVGAWFVPSGVMVFGSALPSGGSEDVTR